MKWSFKLRVLGSVILSSIVLLMSLSVGFAKSSLDQYSCQEIKNNIALLNQELDSYQLRKTVKRCPNNANLWNNLGLALEKHGGESYQEAIKSYEQAKQLDQTFPLPFIGIGDVYFSLAEKATRESQREQASQYKRKAIIAYCEFINKGKVWKSKVWKKHELAKYIKARQDRMNLLIRAERYPAPNCDSPVISADELLRSLDRGLTVREANSAPRLLIFFDSDQAVIKPKYDEQMTEAIKASKIFNKPLIVEGHADYTGNEDDNKKLSLARAQAVAERIRREVNIPIKACGYGSEKPIMTGKSESAKSQNRRVVLVSGTSCN